MVFKNKPLTFLIAADICFLRFDARSFSQLDLSKKSTNRPETN